MRRGLIALLVLGASLALGGPAARAAGPPQIAASWVTEVTATSANLRAEINPNGATTTYRFEYITEAAYQANLNATPSREGFSGAALTPIGGVGAGSSDIPVIQQLSGLAPLTTYRYRVVATNSANTTTGPVRSLGTEAPTNVFALLDNRAWELVSPVDKSGGAVAFPAALFGGGAFQAAANGESATYSSASSFAGGAGAPGASQYLSARGEAGWSTANITTPALSGSYGDRPDGVPYRIFSGDLFGGLLSNGQRCRGEGSACPVANPPLPGSGAPAGYRNYYLRGGSSGAFQALLTQADLAHTALAADEFELSLAGTTPELSHVVVSTCAALSANAGEVPAAGGCDPAAQNLYEWSGSGLTLLNLLPGETEGTPGATLAAPSGAISADGRRVYFSVGEDGPLYLREADGPTKLLPETLGGGAAFQSASADGGVAFFLTGSHLFRYDAGTETSTDLTPGGGVEGVLGASADGSRVYYLTTAGLFFWESGSPTEVAPGLAAAASSDYPPATGTARVSADGSHLAFLSAAELSGYENEGETELYLYGPPPGGGAPRLLCASCNPTGERANGPASIPGAVANGSTVAYKPRVLSANGHRVFFDSEDKLSIQDTDNRPDVYEWEAAGEGSCAQAPGCVQLVSSGRSPETSAFVDASADGSSAFFLTNESLVPADPGSIDLYVAREGGGFAVPPSPIPCNGDACQALPEAPEDPTPGTLVPNAGNPPLHFPKSHKKKHHHKKHHKKKHHGRGGR
jgi:hypothetical protein